MRIPESEPEPVVSHSRNQLSAAVENWHRMCQQACAENLVCADRFTSVIDSLITWVAENPDAARLYFGDGADCGAPELIRLVQSAKQRLTSALTDEIAPCGRRDHRTRVEFVIGAVRQIIREELRRETVDHARLAHKLTRLTPLVVDFPCAAHR